MKLIFTNPSTPASKLIKLIDGGKYSHVGILTNNASAVAHATMAKGVIRQPLDVFVKLFPEHEVVSFTAPCEQQGEEWLLQQTGKPYDFGALWKFIFPCIELGEADKWYCSELAMATMLMSGIEIPQADNFGVHRLYGMAKALEALEALK